MALWLARVEELGRSIRSCPHVASDHAPYLAQLSFDVPSSTVSTDVITYTRTTHVRPSATNPSRIASLRVWKVYLKWAERRGERLASEYETIPQVDPSLTERYVSILLAQTEDKTEERMRTKTTKNKHNNKAKVLVPRHLRPRKLLLGLARGSMDGHTPVRKARARTSCLSSGSS